MIGRKISDQTITCKVIKPIHSNTVNNHNVIPKSQLMNQICQPTRQISQSAHENINSCTNESKEGRYFGINNRDVQISLDVNFNNKNQCSRPNNYLKDQKQKNPKINEKQGSRNVTHYFINNKQKPLNVQIKKVVSSSKHFIDQNQIKNITEEKALQNKTTNLVKDLKQNKIEQETQKINLISENNVRMRNNNSRNKQQTKPNTRQSIQKSVQISQKQKLFNECKGPALSKQRQTNSKDQNKQTKNVGRNSHSKNQSKHSNNQIVERSKQSSQHSSASHQTLNKIKETYNKQTKKHDQMPKLKPTLIKNQMEDEQGHKKQILSLQNQIQDSYKRPLKNGSIKFGISKACNHQVSDRIITKQQNSMRKQQKETTKKRYLSVKQQIQEKLKQKKRGQQLRKQQQKVVKYRQIDGKRLKEQPNERNLVTRELNVWNRNDELQKRSIKKQVQGVCQSMNTQQDDQQQMQQLEQRKFIPQPIGLTQTERQQAVVGSRGLSQAYNKQESDRTQTKKLYNRGIIIDGEQYQIQMIDDSRVIYDQVIKVAWNGQGNQANQDTQFMAAIQMDMVSGSKRQHESNSLKINYIQSSSQQQQNGSTSRMQQNLQEPNHLNQQTYQDYYDRFNQRTNLYVQQQDNFFHKQKRQNKYHRDPSSQQHNGEWQKSVRKDGKHHHDSNSQQHNEEYVYGAEKAAFQITGKRQQIRKETQIKGNPSKVKIKGNVAISHIDNIHKNKQIIKEDKQSSQQESQQDNPKLQEYLIKSRLLSQQKHHSQSRQNKLQDYVSNKHESYINNRNNEPPIGQQKVNFKQVTSSNNNTQSIKIRPRQLNTQILFNKAQVIVEMDQEYLQSSVVDRTKVNNHNLLMTNNGHEYSMQQSQGNLQAHNQQGNRDRNDQINYNYIQDSSEDCQLQYREQQQHQNNTRSQLAQKCQKLNNLTLYPTKSQNNMIQQNLPKNSQQLNQLFQLNLQSLLNKQFIEINNQSNY